MAVTKRTRFEVLRRDNHTCRYCHESDAPLTVDHVVPVALGGTDAPANLVAACKDCNAGKSSSSPDGSLVAEVKEDTLRQANQIEQAYAVLVERMGVRDDYIDAWSESYTFTPLPTDWRNTIARWFDMGVPLELIVDAAKIACSKAQPFYGDQRFAYMCGIVWNQVHAVREVTATREAIEGAILSEEELTTLETKAFHSGSGVGWSEGWKAGCSEYGFADVYSRLVASVVDHTVFEYTKAWPGQPVVREAELSPWATQ